MAILHIPVPKAGKGAFIPFDTDELISDDFPAEAYLAIIYEGVKHYANLKMSKQSPASKQPEGPEREKASKAAMEIAEANMANLRKGEIRKAAGAKSKISGAVKTEAMRMARALIKDALRADGKKVSLIPAKEITALAHEYLESEYGEETIKKAMAVIEERTAKVTASIGIDLSRVKEDAKLTERAAIANAAKAAEKAAVASTKKKPEGVNAKSRGQANA